ncbi:MAG: hypothetical protein AAGD11_03985 [Planctomycetota bacterium]
MPIKSPTIDHTLANHAPEIPQASSKYLLCEDPQINVAPNRAGGLWKVITHALRCPQCQSIDTKALTGKRLNGEGLLEQYRQCTSCQLRFRLILE